MDDVAQGDCSLLSGEDDRGDPEQSVRLNTQSFRPAVHANRLVKAAC
jgi:hypothetical protein